MAGKTDSVSIRVSYRNLKDTKVEMMGMDDEPHHRIDLNSSRPSPLLSSSSSAWVPNGNGDLPLPQSLSVPNQNTLMTLILSCTVAAGVQFGWALQLSLLTPYIQGRHGRLGGDHIRFKQREKGRKPTHKQIHTCSL